ncbi:MAG: hypothetical protein ABJ327_18565 [Litoreibacter sp.]
MAKLIEQSDERLERYLRDLEHTDGADNAVTDTAKTQSLCDKIDAIKGKRDRLLDHLHTPETSGEERDPGPSLTKVIEFRTACFERKTVSQDQTPLRIEHAAVVSRNPVRENSNLWRKK